jgi:hypothetical protein
MIGRWFFLEPAVDGADGEKGRQCLASQKLSMLNSSMAVYKGTDVMASGIPRLNPWRIILGGRTESGLAKSKKMRLVAQQDASPYLQNESIISNFVRDFQNCDLPG